MIKIEFQNKNSLLYKRLVKRWKDNIQTERTFGNHISNKRLISRIHKGHLMLLWGFMGDSMVNNLLAMEFWVWFQGLEDTLEKDMVTSVQFSSVAQSCLILRPRESWHTRPPSPSPTPGACSNSCPLSWWCHPAISSSVGPFTSCTQSLPASGSFPMSQLFAWGGQTIGVSASASVLPMNTQDWSPLRWTGWIALQSKGLSRVFPNTTVQKHQFFGAQLSSQSNSHIHT